MKGRKSYADSARARLLDHWQGQPEFGAPVGCVTTTYTFDAGFFEEECLARFIGMESDPHEDGHAYLIEREEKLAPVTASVLVDASQVAAHRTLRWHQLGARIPGGGILHAKVTLLVWSERIRVLVGSANLTEPGYRRNFEQQAALEFGAHGDLPHGLLTSVLDYLARLLDFVAADSIFDGPRSRTLALIERARRLGATWPAHEWGRGEPRATFVPVVPGGETFFEAAARIWPFEPARDAWVLSPFFNDDEKSARQVAAGVETLLMKRGNRRITWLAPGVKLPDDSIELALPDAYRESPTTSLTYEHKLVLDREDLPGGPELRALHAKSYWFGRDDQAMFIIGSSNCTAAGTGVRKAGVINVEANLAYVIPDYRSSFAKICEASYPPTEEIDVDTQEIRFLQPNERTPEAAAFAPLPFGFASALFVPGATTGSIRLTFDTDTAPPPMFTIRAEDESLILDAPSWTAAGSPLQLDLPWTAQRPPTCLLVHWRGEHGELTALWIVNVSDTGKLPPPDELRALGLEELLEVLTSSRPAHEVITQMTRRAEEKAAAVDRNLDPHHRVDTRNFLLKRMRRLGSALEGLRERLERPCHSLEGMSWRLLGPFGPLQLARRLATEEGEGASFFIAEVAHTIRACKFSTGDAIDRSEIEGLVKQVEAELATLAFAKPAPANLQDYVRRTFPEVRA